MHIALFIGGIVVVLGQRKCEAQCTDEGDGERACQAAENNKRPANTDRETQSVGGGVCAEMCHSSTASAGFKQGATAGSLNYY